MKTCRINGLGASIRRRGVLQQPGLLLVATANGFASPGDGRARINLRGLGAGRTLVLSNGRRLAPSGLSRSPK